MNFTLDTINLYHNISTSSFFFFNSNSITSPRKSLRKNYIVNYDRMEFKIEIELSFGLLTGRITKKLAYTLEI